jgi:hypothetical protein
MDLIPFEEARELLHLNQKICRGLKQIELDKIRGSVGRYQDFTSAFLPRRDNLRQRWQGVWSAKTTKGLPPIELYKVAITASQLPERQVKKLSMLMCVNTSALWN